MSKTTYYRHSKSGHIYTSKEVGTFEEDMDTLVSYTRWYDTSSLELDGDGDVVLDCRVWYRRASIFYDQVEIDGETVPRFVEIPKPETMLDQYTEYWEGLSRCGISWQEGMKLFAEYPYQRNEERLPKRKEGWRHDLGIRVPDFADEETATIIMDRVAYFTNYDGYAPIKSELNGETRWLIDPSIRALQAPQTCHYPSKWHAVIAMLQEYKEYDDS